MNPFEFFWILKNYRSDWHLRSCNLTDSFEFLEYLGHPGSRLQFFRASWVLRLWKFKTPHWALNSWWIMQFFFTKETVWDALWHFGNNALCFCCQCLDHISIRSNFCNMKKKLFLPCVDMFSIFKSSQMPRTNKTCVLLFIENSCSQEHTVLPTL